MVRALVVSVLLLGFIILLVQVVTAVAQMEGMQPIASIEIEGSSNITVLSNGVAVADSVLKMSMSAYKTFKTIYDPLSTFVRELNWGNTPAQLVDVKVEADDATNTIRIHYKRLGAAVYLGDGKWKLNLEADEGARVKLVDKKDNTLIVTVTYQSTKEMEFAETLRITLPKKASNIVFDKDEKTIYYSMPLPGGKDEKTFPRYAGSALAATGIMVMLIPLIRREKRGPEMPPPPPVNE